MLCTIRATGFQAVDGSSVASVNARGLERIMSAVVTKEVSGTTKSGYSCLCC